MRKLLHRLLDIREGEALRASLMFAYIFLIIASLMIVKPVRNSLFLVEFGVEKLPYVFVLVALCAALVAWLYSKFSTRVRLDRLILHTMFISTACLFAFWLLLHFGHQGGWLLFVFYIWVAIFGLLVSTQFWLLANYVFNVREAKRLFGFVGAGGISGAIFGGYLTNYLAPRLRTENLIFFCIGFLCACMILFWQIWKRSGRQSYRERTQSHKIAGQTGSTDNPIKLILNSHHLTYVAGIIGVSVVVANLVDYQFSAVASQVIPETDRLTAFFGFWMSNLSVFSLGVQLALTGRVMKYFGVTASLFFLPVGILVGATAILFNPALWSAVLIKVSDGAFKHSINKAGVELLALPIPAGVKNRAKAFIDIFVDNLATGLAGLLLIVLAAALSFSVEHVSLIVAVLIAVWIYLILRVKGEYVNSFRLAIEKRTIDLEQQSLNLQDASVLDGLTRVLDGDNERQIVYVLNLIERVQNKELIPYLRRLAGHPSGETRVLVLKMAHQYEGLDLSSEAAALIDSDNQTLGTEAVRYLCERSEDKLDTLTGYLNHRDYRVRSAALMYAAEKSKESKRFREAINLERLIGGMLKTVDRPGEGEAQERLAKADAARVIGAAGDLELYPYLNLLLKDQSPEVVRAAVVSAGQIRSEECAPALIGHLGTKGVRKYARQALARYGEEVVGRLAQVLESPEEDEMIRRRIPGVLALIGSQRSVEVLMNTIDHQDLPLRYEAMKALNKLRVKFPALKSNKVLIEERIADETKHYYRTLTILYRQRNPETAKSAPESLSDRPGADNRARKLLISALEEKLDDNLERIFRLLGLRYRPKDMYNAYLGITSQKSNLRADSVELLDNVLKTDLKKVIIPIVERTPTEVLMGKIRELFGFDLPTEEEGINLLLEGDDNWLKACTLYFIAEMNYRQYLVVLANLTDDPDPMVKETSKYCLDRMRISN